MTLVGGAAGLLAILAWGDVVVAWSDGGGRRRPMVGQLALAWLAGSVVTTWLVFLGLWCGLGLRPAVAAVAVAGSAAWVARRRRPTHTAGKSAKAVRRRPGGVEILALALIAAVLAEVGLVALSGPPTAWDAWVNFASRARVLLVDDGLSPALHADTDRLATNLDYPLMLPLGEAWLAVAGGLELDRAVGIITFAHAVALAGIFWAAVRRRLARAPALSVTALLVTLPYFDRFAAAGLADVPMAALVVAALALAAEEIGAPAVSGGRRWVLPAVLAAGLPWLKLEGWVWWGLAVAAFAAAGGGRRGWRPALGWGLLVAAPGASWQLFLLVAGTARYAFDPPLAGLAWQRLDRLPAIAAEVGRHLIALDWSLLWLVVPVAVLVRPRRVVRGSSGRALLAVVGFLLVLACSFLWSRFDPWRAHLVDSIDRLAWQAAPLALWWLAARAAELGWIRAREPA